MWQILERRLPLSTPYTDLNHDQEVSHRAPGTIYTEDTLELEKKPPTLNASQPPKPPSHNRRKAWSIIAAVVIVLALVFSVLAFFIAQPGKNTGTQVTPTAPGTTITTTPGGDTKPSPSPGVTQGPQNGPPNVNSPAYWDTILGTKGTNGKVESVSFADVLGNSTLQALVTVRHSDANRTLDVYVFDKITSKNPVQIFQLGGLIKGEAKISYYNSIMTAEVDQHSGVNVGKPASQMKLDLYREFAWNNAQGKLVQVAFPGIFPDLTRYQAEADQARVNKGNDTWKNDAAQVAKALASESFKWTRAVTTKVLSGGGPKDVYATVQVQESPVTGGSKFSPTAYVTLSRLEGNTHNMWVAIAVNDDANTLTNIAARSLVASPVTLKGKGGAFEGVIGQAYIWDHLYNPIGQALVKGTPAMANAASYSTAVSYVSSFKAGAQEGVVQILFTTPIEADPSTTVMVKVLLDPKPVVVQGPVSCPIVTQVQGYWSHFLGLDTSTSSVGTVSCANLKGDASLQALVPVFYQNGKPGEVYVFDNLTNFDLATGPHPVQIFKLQTQGASISGVSTIMTTDGDLYREFKWSGKAGTFVQVVFPGLFPDMTRLQAEQSQSAVLAGQDTWKLDPVRTTQHWNLLGGTAKLVKGGGPNDLTAVVNVTYPASGGPTTNIPITQVTLNRLEGQTNGIWEITSVGSNWLFIYTPKSSATISSPVTVTGFGPQFEAQIGTVYILDRLYKQIQVGNNFAMAPDGSSPPSKFSLDVKYTSSATGNAQEGIVELVHTSGPSFARGEVMVKVLINSGTPSVQEPSYWTQFVSAPPAIRVADSVSFGHLLGQSSLQAVVVARDILGGGPVYRDVFVFDKINDPKPQLLWHESRLLHGDAKISGYNTVMTAQVDVNSSLNKGKLEAGLKTDLYREFKWSSGAGTFVQTAFPGIFPDLTRYQAEADQTQVNAGHDTWKNDPALVAKALTAQFFKWQRTVTTKVLSGGGPQDVYATVQVQEAPVQGGQIQGPYVVVTLSRLEGNIHNMWVATDVKDGTIVTLANIPTGSLISSPVTLTGTGAAYEAVIGQAVVYDHLYTDIGHSQIKGDKGAGQANYSTIVAYTSSFNGVQEGIVVVYQDNAGISSENFSAVMVKVLIKG